MACVCDDMIFYYIEGDFSPRPSVKRKYGVVARGQHISRSQPQIIAACRDARLLQEEGKKGRKGAKNPALTSDPSPFTSAANET